MENNVLFKLSRELILQQLKVEVKFDGSYFKRVETEKDSKLNDSEALMFKRLHFAETLFSGLQPEFYNFDYNRPVEEWKDYNQLEDNNWL